MAEAKVKKYRCEVKDTKSRPAVYPLVKGWLTRNHIDYKEDYGYSCSYLVCNLSLYEVSQILDLLDEYGVIKNDQNQLTIGF